MSRVRDTLSGGGWAWSLEELEQLNERYEIGTGPTMRDCHVQVMGPLDDDWRRPLGRTYPSVRTAVWTADHHARGAVKARVVDAETCAVLWTSWEPEQGGRGAA